MLDIAKQVRFWCEGAQEELAVARELLDRGRIRHSLFFAHLAVEKMAKAAFCKATRMPAPKSHDLLRLVTEAGLALEPRDTEFLGQMGIYAIEGRYPGELAPAPTREEAAAILAQADEVNRWIERQL